MNRLVRVGLSIGALSLALALAGCESFDPTAIFDTDIFNPKKKLPGERRPVFPDGTPGVPQGVPAELVKGYQAPAEPAAAPKQATAEPAEPKPKPKPKPKVVAKPAEQSTPTPAPAQPTGPSSQQSQWPDPPQTQRAPAASGWPGSPQPSGGVAWPDPPAPR